MIFQIYMRRTQRYAVKLILREIITRLRKFASGLDRLNSRFIGRRREDIVGVCVCDPGITGLVHYTSILDGFLDTLEVLDDLERKAHSVVLFHVSCSFGCQCRGQLTQPMWQCMSQTPGLLVSKATTRKPDALFTGSAGMTATSRRGGLLRLSGVASV